MNAVIWVAASGNPLWANSSAGLTETFSTQTSTNSLPFDSITELSTPQTIASLWTTSTSELSIPKATISLSATSTSEFSAPQVIATLWPLPSASGNSALGETSSDTFSTGLGNSWTTLSREFSLGETSTSVPADILSDNGANSYSISQSLPITSQIPSLNSLDSMSLQIPPSTVLGISTDLSPLEAPSIKAGASQQFFSTSASSGMSLHRTTSLRPNGPLPLEPTPTEDQSSSAPGLDSTSGSTSMTLKSDSTFESGSASTSELSSTSKTSVSPDIVAPVAPVPSSTGFSSASVSASTIEITSRSLKLLASSSLREVSSVSIQESTLNSSVPSEVTSTAPTPHAPMVPTGIESGIASMSASEFNSKNTLSGIALLSTATAPESLTTLAEAGNSTVHMGITVIPFPLNSPEMPSPTLLATSDVSRTPISSSLNSFSRGSRPSSPITAPASSILSTTAPSSPSQLSSSLARIKSAAPSAMISGLNTKPKIPFATPYPPLFILTCDEVCTVTQTVTECCSNTCVETYSPTVIIPIGPSPTTVTFIPTVRTTITSSSTITVIEPCPVNPMITPPPLIIPPGVTVTENPTTITVTDECTLTKTLTECSLSSCTTKSTVTTYTPTAPTETLTVMPTARTTVSGTVTVTVVEPCIVPSPTCNICSAPPAPVLPPAITTTTQTVTTCLENTCISATQTVTVPVPKHIPTPTMAPTTVTYTLVETITSCSENSCWPVATSSFTVTVTTESLCTTPRTTTLVQTMRSCASDSCSESLTTASITVTPEMPKTGSIITNEEQIPPSTSLERLTSCEGALCDYTTLSNLATPSPKTPQQELTSVTNVEKETSPAPQVSMMTLTSVYTTTPLPTTQITTRTEVSTLTSCADTCFDVTTSVTRAVTTVFTPEPTVATQVTVLPTSEVTVITQTREYTRTFTTCADNYCSETTVIGTFSTSVTPDVPSNFAPTETKSSPPVTTEACAGTGCVPEMLPAPTIECEAGVCTPVASQPLPGSCTDSECEVQPQPVESVPVISSNSAQKCQPTLWLGLLAITLVFT